MIKLIDTEGQDIANHQQTQEWILTQLVVNFADDVEFIRKLNKITFGLITNNLKTH